MADSIPSREECIVFVRTLLDNAMSIGATKTGAERLGWLEDARFQSAILTALTAPVSETSTPADDVMETLCRVRDSLNGSGAWAGAQKCVMAIRALNTQREATKAHGGTTDARAHGVPTPGSFGGLENGEEVIAKPSNHSKETPTASPYDLNPNAPKEYPGE